MLAYEAHERARVRFEDSMAVNGGRIKVGHGLPRA